MHFKLKEWKNKILREMYSCSSSFFSLSVIKTIGRQKPTDGPQSQQIKLRNIRFAQRITNLLFF